MALGKALGAGVPIGAALFSERGRGRRSSSGDHGSTYGGNLLACRAALVFLDELIERRPARRTSRRVGAHLERRLRALASQPADRRGGARRRPDVGPRARSAGAAGRRRRARARRCSSTARRTRSSGCCRRSSSPTAEIDEALGAARCRRSRAVAEVTAHERDGDPSDGDADDAAAIARADHRQPRRRATCCRARSSELDVARRRASSSRIARRHGRRLRRAGAAQRRRSPKSGRWSSTRRCRGQRIGSRARRRAAPRARREPASRRCARSRTSRRTSSASASRSCRTSGCRRRSRTTASACPLFRHCGQYAVMLPLAPASGLRPSSRPR